MDVTHRLNLNVGVCAQHNNSRIAFFGRWNLNGEHEEIDYKIENSSHCVCVSGILALLST